MDDGLDDDSFTDGEDRWFKADEYGEIEDLLCGSIYLNGFRWSD